MECVVKWAGGDSMTFLAETGSGHLVGMDGAPEAGGRNLAPRPMELMLAGAGGCTAFCVVLILKRSRQDVVDCAVSLKADRAETDPKVFTRIAFHYTAPDRHARLHLQARVRRARFSNWLSRARVPRSPGHAGPASPVASTADRSAARAAARGLRGMNGLRPAGAGPLH